MIHRDVKPSNVICPRAEDGLGGAKLTDFGIARMADHDVLTRTGDIMGTLAYMAPEQARGEKITGAVDVYGLGVVLYEALAGVNPIRAGNPAATARRVGMRLPPLHRVRRDLPGELCRAIDAAVAPEASARAGLARAAPRARRLGRAVGDVQGPVAGGALDTIARPALARTRTHLQRRERDPRAAPAAPPARRLHSAPRRPSRSSEEPRARRRIGPAPRLAAACGAAALVAGALAWSGPQPPLDPAAGAALVGAVVLLFPLLGWLLAAAALLAWLIGPVPGVALLAALAAVPVPVLLAGRATTWSLPAAAPLLGAIGIAGAWPALAGQAARWQVRAALGALGGWWLSLAELLASDRLVFGAPHEVLIPAAWEGSALAATRDALWPLLAGGGLALAALWGLAAVALPLFVRGRSAALDLVGAAAWAGALAAATGALSEALVLDAPRGLVLGAVASGVIAVAARAAFGRVGARELIGPP